MLFKAKKLLVVIAFTASLASCAGRGSTPPGTQTSEKTIPTPSSKLIERFAWQTDGQFGYSMLRPANWQVVELGPGRAYALPGSNADFGQVVLRVVNYQAKEEAQSDSNGAIAQMLIFKENPSLDGWAGGIERMWRDLGIKYTLEGTTGRAKVYFVQPPDTNEVQLIALIVSDQQPLTIELSVSGGQTELERLRATGVLDDFMVVVNSASAIPYDPANVEPPLGERSILHLASSQA